MAARSLLGMKMNQRAECERGDWVRGGRGGANVSIPDRCSLEYGKDVQSYKLADPERRMLRDPVTS